MQKGQNSEAEKYYKEAVKYCGDIQISPRKNKLTALVALLGGCLQREHYNNMLEARKQFDLGLAAAAHCADDPNYYVLIANLSHDMALTYLREEDYPMAIEYFEKSIKAATDDKFGKLTQFIMPAKNYLANALAKYAESLTVRSGDLFTEIHQQYLQQMSEKLSINYDYSAHLYHYGNFKLFNKEYAEALELLMQALPLLQQQCEGGLQRRLGDLWEAIAKCHIGLKNFGDARKALAAAESAFSVNADKVVRIDQLRESVNGFMLKFSTFSLFSNSVRINSTSQGECQTFTYGLR